MERDKLEKKMKEELDALRAELEPMTVAQIEDYKLGLREQVEALKARERAAESVRSKKINREGLAAKLGVPVDHLSDKDVERFTEIARQPKEGDVIATPGVATVVVEGQGGDE